MSTCEGECPEVISLHGVMIEMFRIEEFLKCPPLV